jgi:hypothetical protein
LLDVKKGAFSAFTKKNTADKMSAVFSTSFLTYNLTKFTGSHQLLSKSEVMTLNLKKNRTAHSILWAVVFATGVLLGRFIHSCPKDRCVFLYGSLPTTKATQA